MQVKRMLDGWLRHKKGLKMRNLVFTILGLITMLFTSCNYKQIADRYIPKEESEYGKNVLEAVRSNDFISVSKTLNKSIASQVTKEKLEEIARYFPSEKLINIEIIGSHVHKINNDWNGSFTFEYEFENSKWAVANIVVNKSNDTLSVTGFHVYLTERSQKEINQFTLRNKSIKHYIILLFTIFFLIFSLYTFIVCIRTPIEKKKVLWAIFTLLGLTSIGINWTTGQLSFQLLTVQLLSASATAASPYSPWFVSFSIPIGALMFWIKRSRIKRVKIDSIVINNDEDI